MTIHMIGATHRILESDGFFHPQYGDGYRWWYYWTRDLKHHAHYTSIDKAKRFLSLISY